MGEVCVDFCFTIMAHLERQRAFHYLIISFFNIIFDIYSLETTYECLKVLPSQDAAKKKTSSKVSPIGTELKQ